MDTTGSGEARPNGKTSLKLQTQAPRENGDASSGRCNENGQPTLMPNNMTQEQRNHKANTKSFINTPPFVPRGFSGKHRPGTPWPTAAPGTKRSNEGAEESHVSPNGSHRNPVGTGAKRKRSTSNTTSRRVESSDDEEEDSSAPSTSPAHSQATDATSIRQVEDGAGFEAVKALNDFQDNMPANGHLLILLGMVPAYSGPPPMSTMRIAELFGEKEHSKFTHRYKRLLDKAYGTGCAKEYAAQTKAAKHARQDRSVSDNLEAAIKAIRGNPYVPLHSAHDPYRIPISRSITREDQDVDEGDDFRTRCPTRKSRKRRRTEQDTDSHRIMRSNGEETEKTEASGLVVFISPIASAEDSEQPELVPLLTHEEASRYNLDTLARHRARTRLLDDNFGNEAPSSASDDAGIQPEIALAEPHLEELFSTAPEMLDDLVSFVDQEDGAENATLDAFLFGNTGS